MGRTKLFTEQMQARFADGTFEMIAAVLKPDEDRTEFVRVAVEREMKRRINRSKDPELQRRFRQYDDPEYDPGC